MKKVSINCKEIKYIRFTLGGGRHLSGYRNRKGLWDTILHNIYIYRRSALGRYFRYYLSNTYD